GTVLQRDRETSRGLRGDDSAAAHDKHLTRGIAHVGALPLTSSYARVHLAWGGAESETAKNLSTRPVTYSRHGGGSGASRVSPLRETHRAKRRNRIPRIPR